MRILFLIIVIGALTEVLVAQSFYVEKVEVFDNFNSSYLLLNANVLIPPDKAVGMREIEAYFQEIKASSLFLDIKWSLSNTQEKDVYVLKITPVYRTDYCKVRIDDIVLEGLSYTNNQKFFEALKKEGIEIGSKFTNNSFSRLVDKIHDAVNNSQVRDNSKKINEGSWVIVREGKLGGVKIIVSPS